VSITPGRSVNHKENKIIWWIWTILQEFLQRWILAICMWQSCWRRHLKEKNTRVPCSRANEIPRGIKSEIQNELIASQKVLHTSFCPARLTQKRDARIVFRSTNCVLSVGVISLDLLLSFYWSFYINCCLTVRVVRWLPRVLLLFCDACGLSWWVPSNKDVSLLIIYAYL